MFGGLGRAQSYCGKLYLFKSMKVYAKVSAEKMKQKMREYEKVLGVNIRESMRKHSRLLAVDLMGRTQPFSLGGGGKAKAKQQAQNAVDNDLMRAFRAIAKEELKKVLAAKERGVNFYRAKHYPKNELFWVDVNRDFLAGDAEMKSHHNALRNKRGRVPKRARYAIVATPDFKRYRMAVRKMIGWAKAGWASAASKVKADTKSAESMRDIPVWVKRHIGNGKVWDQAKGSNPSITMKSGVSYMSAILPPAARDESLQKTKRNYIKFLQAAIRGELKRIGNS